MYVLTVYVNPSFDDAVALHSLYKTHIENHNRNAENNTDYADSGFDLLVPKVYKPYNCETFMPEELLIVDHQVVIKLKKSNYNSPLPFYMYARSSLGKKKRLRLANSVGIIDAGYYGNIIAVFDVLKRNSENDPDTENALRHERLVQVCAPDLSPLKVVLEPLGNVPPVSGERGVGGLGSTG